MAAQHCLALSKQAVWCGGSAPALRTHTCWALQGSSLRGSLCRVRPIQALFDMLLESATPRGHCACEARIDHSHAPMLDRICFRLPFWSSLLILGLNSSRYPGLLLASSRCCFKRSCRITAHQLRRPALPADSKMPVRDSVLQDKQVACQRHPGTFRALVISKAAWQKCAYG